MAQTRLLELVVGLFVCLGLAALFLLTLQVSTANGLSGGDTYRVTARFANIGGLSTRAPVAMAGVDIGRVESIALDEKSFEAVVTLAGPGCREARRLLLVEAQARVAAGGMAASEASTHLAEECLLHGGLRPRGRCRTP